MAGAQFAILTKCLVKPATKQYWQYYMSVRMINDLMAGRMYPLTIEGLEEAMENTMTPKAKVAQASQFQLLSDAHQALIERVKLLRSAKLHIALQILPVATGYQRFNAVERAA